MSSKRDNEKARIAFTHAQTVLAWLEDKGIEPHKFSAELFADGSGHLIIHDPEILTAELKKEIEQALHSSRWEQLDNDSIILSSCQGWHP